MAPEAFEIMEFTPENGALSRQTAPALICVMFSRSVSFVTRECKISHILSMIISRTIRSFLFTETSDSSAVSNVNHRARP